MSSVLLPPLESRYIPQRNRRDEPLSSAIRGGTSLFPRRCGTGSTLESCILALAVTIRTRYWVCRDLLPHCVAIARSSVLIASLCRLDKRRDLLVDGFL